MDRGWRSGTRGGDTGLAPDAGAGGSGALSLKTAVPATRSARAGAALGGEGAELAIHRGSIGERARGAACGSRVWSGELGWVGMAKLCELLILDNFQNIAIFSAWILFEILLH